MRPRSYTMQKSVRLFVLVAMISLAAAPSLKAERAGTNPHPQMSATTTMEPLRTLF